MIALSYSSIVADQEAMRLFVVWTVEQRPPRQRHLISWRAGAIHIVSYHTYHELRKPHKLKVQTCLLAMADCISLHTARGRIGLYSFIGENDSPVATSRSPITVIVALSAKLVGLIGGIICSQSLRARAADSLPNVIDPSALRLD
jgi:hypothetical protein